MNMHLALSEIRFTRSLRRNILIVFIICALPMWMLIRSFMPSESVVEYLERISEAMPKFDLQIDNEEVRYFAIRDAETVSLVFKKNWYSSILSPRTNTSWCTGKIVSV